MRHEQNERQLSDLPKWLFRLLLLADAIAIIVSMVSGPMGYGDMSVGAAASAIFLSLCLLLYGLLFWRKNRR